MKMIVFVVFMSMTLGLAAQEDGDALEYFPQQLKASRLLYYCAGSALTASGRERVKTCAGFISGVEEAVRLLQTRGLLKEPSGICVPGVLPHPCSRRPTVATRQVTRTMASPRPRWLSRCSAKPIPASRPNRGCRAYA